MRAFKTRAFARWARGEGLGDETLAAAVAEMERGLIDANLGGQVVKKRVALPGRGKRGGSRTLVAVKQAEEAFFIFGFAKNEPRQCQRRGAAGAEVVGQGVAELPGVIARQSDRRR